MVEGLSPWWRDQIPSTFGCLRIMQLVHFERSQKGVCRMSTSPCRPGTLFFAVTVTVLCRGQSSSCSCVRLAGLEWHCHFGCGRNTKTSRKNRIPTDRPTLCVFAVAGTGACCPLHGHSAFLLRAFGIRHSGVQTMRSCARACARDRHDTTRGEVGAVAGQVWSIKHNARATHEYRG